MDGLLAVAADHTDDPRCQVAIANAVFLDTVTRAMSERAILAHGAEQTLPAVEAEPRRFRRLAKGQGQFRTIETDRHFGIGLDAMLDGLLGRLRPHI